MVCAYGSRGITCFSCFKLNFFLFSFIYFFHPLTSNQYTNKTNNDNQHNEMEYRTQVEEGIRNEPYKKNINIRHNIRCQDTPHDTRPRTTKQHSLQTHCTLELISVRSQQLSFISSRMTNSAFCCISKKRFPPKSYT